MITGGKGRRMRNHIIKCIVFTVFFCFPVVSEGKEFNSSEYILTLGDKAQATCEDVVTIFILQTGKTPNGYDKDVPALRDAGIGAPERAATDPLRRGEAAAMVARYFKLKQSLFFNIFDSDRYAVRACVAAGIMEEDTSEWDILSGEQLLEIMRRAGEKSEGGAK